MGKTDSLSLLVRRVISMQNPEAMSFLADLIDLRADPKRSIHRPDYTWLHCRSCREKLVQVKIIDNQLWPTSGYHHWHRVSENVFEIYCRQHTPTMTHRFKSDTLYELVFKSGKKAILP